MTVFKVRLWAGLLCCSFVISGCSTIVNGTSQDIVVSTNPEGAIVSDGTCSMTTPCTLKLHRGETYLLTISKAGYESKTVLLKHKISKWVIGDILLGVVGVGVDALTGAIWYQTPENISVMLTPINEKLAHGTVEFPKKETLEEKLSEIEQLKQKNAITEEESISMKTIVYRSFNVSEPAKG